MTRMGKMYGLAAASVVFLAAAAASVQAEEKLSIAAQTLAASIDENVLRKTCPLGRDAMIDLVRNTYRDYASTHPGGFLPNSAVPETVRYLLTQRCRGAK